MTSKMGKINEGLKTFNATVRTVIGATFVGLFGYGGYFGYSEYTKYTRELATAKATIDQLNIELETKTKELEKLETSMRLLKTDQRLARLEVMSMRRDAQDKTIESTVKFYELSPKGDPISQGKVFTLPGDVIYIDNWIIKFDDQYIEQADLQRGTSLCLFKRIFSDQIKPSDGFSLDEIGSRPQAYARGGQVSDFEKQLWNDFWKFANDPAKAAQLGIRAANGEAVSIQIQEGKKYGIELRASGGLSIKPL